MRQISRKTTPNIAPRYNTSVVTLLDGGVVSVRGTGTVGSKVYIRAGRIEGPAPSMAQNEIVV